MILIIVIVVLLVGIGITATLVYRTIKQLNNEKEPSKSAKSDRNPPALQTTPNSKAIALAELDRYLVAQDPIKFAQPSNEHNHIPRINVPNHDSMCGLKSRARSPVGSQYTQLSVPKFSIPTTLTSSNNHRMARCLRPAPFVEDTGSLHDNDNDDDDTMFRVGDWCEGNFFEQEKQRHDAVSSYFPKQTKPALKIPKLFLSPKKMKHGIRHKQQDEDLVVFQSHREGRGIDKEQDGNLTSRLLPTYQKYQFLKPAQRASMNSFNYKLNKRGLQLKQSGATLQSSLQRSNWITDSDPLPTVQEEEASPTPLVASSTMHTHHVHRGSFSRMQSSSELLHSPASVSTPSSVSSMGSRDSRTHSIHPRKGTSYNNGSLLLGSSSVGRGPSVPVPSLPLRHISQNHSHFRSPAHKRSDGPERISATQMMLCTPDRENALRMMGVV
jgi:hypothetical protein